MSLRTNASTIVDETISTVTAQSISGGEKKNQSDEAQYEERVDEVFGAISSNSPNYVNVGWPGTAILMMKTQIGLGVLSIPYVLETIGIVPGLIAIIVIALITTWSNYVIGCWKIRHPTSHSIADVGMIMYGPWGREFLGAVYWLYMTMIAGSAMLSVSIAFNAVSEHGTCTVVFIVVGAIIIGLLASLQTLEYVAWLGWVGIVSIMAAIFTLTIATAFTRPSAAPTVGAYILDIRAFNNPTFAEASNALATLVFAFGGVPSFFTIVAEMKQPGYFNRAMLICQGTVTAVYIIIGVIVYRFAAQFVATPALGTAGPILKKICYGIALPSLLVAGILYSHLPAKYILVRLLRGSKHMAQNTLIHYIVWAGCVTFCVVFSFIIAAAIPIFNGLIGLIGALLGTAMSMQTMALMWHYDNWDRRHTDKSWKFKITVAWNAFVFIAGSYLLVSGTYGSVIGIINSFNTPGGTTAAFSCADNSATVAS